MRIVFRLHNSIVDTDRVNALNTELHYLKDHGWTIERVQWVGGTQSALNVPTGTLEIQLRAFSDEETLKRLLDSLLRAGKAGWAMKGNLDGGPVLGARLAG